MCHASTVLVETSTTLIECLYEYAVAERRPAEGLADLPARGGPPERAAGRRSAARRASTSRSTRSWSPSRSRPTGGCGCPSSPTPCTSRRSRLTHTIARMEKARTRRADHLPDRPTRGLGRAHRRRLPGARGGRPGPCRRGPPQLRRRGRPRGLGGRSAASSRPSSRCPPDDDRARPDRSRSIGVDHADLTRHRPLRRPTCRTRCAVGAWPTSSTPRSSPARSTPPTPRSTGWCRWPSPGRARSTSC